MNILTEILYWILFTILLFICIPIWIIHFSNQYHVKREYNQYYKCIDNYTSKWEVKNAIDDAINNVKLQLIPHIKEWLELDFYRQIESIQSTTYNHPESNLIVDFWDDLYNRFWWHSRFWWILGLTYKTTNQKKLKSSYLYLIERLREIHEKYSCQKPDTHRDESYSAYKKICERSSKTKIKTDISSICDKNITNRRKYKKHIKERKIQKKIIEDQKKQRKIDRDLKCKEKYWQDHYYKESFFSDEWDCFQNHTWFLYNKEGKTYE